MAQKVQPVPAGYHTVTPHLVLDKAVEALEFYRKAFGAEVLFQMAGPDGKVVHAEMRVGDSNVMVSEEMPPMPGQPGVYKSPKSAGLCTAALFLYVPDADAAFDRAVKAGCTVRQKLEDQFWGDRYGQVIDPYGHTWAIASRKEELTPEEISRRQQAFMASMAGKKP